MAKSHDDSASKMSSEDKEIWGGVISIVIGNIVSFGLVVLGIVLMVIAYNADWLATDLIIGGVIAIVVGLIIAVWLLIATEGMSWIIAPLFLLSLS